MSETSGKQGQWQYAQGTTKKYDIPLSHMDYGYIGECNDVKELEKILKVLRSGDEGCFPDMEKFVEDRITKLAPDSRALRKENQILTLSALDRNERHALSEDLMNWTSSMKSSEHAETGLLNKENEFDDDSLPPVRSGKILVNGHDSQKAEEPRKKKSVKPRSYEEWDKFDIDKELEKADKEKEDKTVRKSAHQPVVEEVIDTSGMTDEEKARKATREKDKGNEAFRSGDYKEAIAYYTRSIQLQSNAASFNNRALAYLKEKEWMKAETDCNKVLTLEPDNIKALLRRGSAYKGKKEFSKALVDFQRVLELEPANKRAEELIEELKKDEKKYEKEKQEKKEKGKRMVIEETDGSDESGDEIIVDKKEKTDEVGMNTAQESPMVNGFHEPANQEPPVTISPKVDTPSTNENSEKKPSNDNKASKDIWDDDEVPIQNSEEESQVASSNRNISNEGQNIRKHQENVAVCENSNNINIENEMKGGSSATESSESENVVEEKVSENESNSPENEESLESEQNRHNETIEAEAVESAESSRDTVTQSEGSVKEPVSERPVLERPVYVQCALPESVSTLREDGNNLFKAGQYGEAIGKYSKAVEQLSKAKEDQRVNLSLIYSNRAACHLKTGSLSEAIKDCTTSLDVVPHSVKPLLRRGNAYEMLERYEKAYADFKHVLSIDSSVEIAHQGSSRCQRHLQQTHGIKWREKLPSIPSVMPWEIPEIRDSASDHIQSPAVQLISSNSPSCSSAQSSTASSESSSSTTKITNSQTKDELSTEEQYEMYKTEGNNLVKKGEYRQAITSYSKCVEVLPDRAVAYCNRSLCYLRTNQAQNAEADCSMALKTEPENVKALFRRAQAKKMLKRYKESLEDLAAVLKLESSNSAAKKEMELVKNYYREELNSLKAKMSKSKGAAPKGTTSQPSSSKPRKRMVIQEVDSEEEEEEESKHNQMNNSTPSTKVKQLSSTLNNSKGKTKVEDMTTKSSKEKVKVEDLTTRSSQEKVKVEDVTTKSSQEKVKEVTKQSKEKGKVEVKSNSAKRKGGNKSGKNKKETEKQQASSSSSTSSSSSSSEKKTPLKSSTIKTTSSGLPKATPSVPKLQEKATPYEFMQAWNSLKSAQDTKPYSDLLKQIPPERLPEVISNKLDGQMLNTITACVSKHYITHGEYSLSYNILSNLCRVDRFGTIAMFLSADEQKEIKSVIDELSKHSQGFSDEDLTKLKSTYSLK